MKVVSLVPSVTETLVTWGRPPAACTRFCEQPDIEHVGGTKNPDVEAIVALAPDVVVMCPEENRIEDADALQAAGLKIVPLSIDSVDDVAPAMRQLASAIHLDGSVLALALGTDVPKARARTISARAFVPIWRRPWMTLSGGTYGSSLLEAVGVANVFADATERYPEVTLEEAVARQPDVVLAPSEPYPFRERHVAELEQVAPVLLVDGQDLFWWGARTPAAIDRLKSLPLLS